MAHSGGGCDARCDEASGTKQGRGECCPWNGHDGHCEAAWEEARAARQMEADLRLSREWLLGLDDDCVDDDYR